MEHKKPTEKGKRLSSKAKAAPGHQSPGHPRKFETAQDLQNAIDKYFRDAKESKQPTGICSLALALGFESRQSLYDNQKIPEYSCIIKKARLMVEDSYENGLRGNCVAGSIFALKNMGWKDSQEVAHSFPESIKVEFI